MKGGGIWNVIFVLVLASVIMGVIQLAILGLIVWGLIMRPLQTAGALLALVMLGLIERYPITGMGLLALIVLAAFLPNRRISTTVDMKALAPPSQERL